MRYVEHIRELARCFRVVTAGDLEDAVGHRLSKEQRRAAFGEALDLGLVHGRGRGGYSSAVYEGEVADEP